MFTRYALYYTPDGAFARLGAAWLGWDIDAARRIAHPDTAGLEISALTQTPRKYGFHATVKAPFVLADGQQEAALLAETKALCKRLDSVRLDRLKIAQLGRFLAFVPLGDQTGLRAFATEVVRELDHFRASPSEDELTRRRKGNLSPEQDRNLRRWGYPHVMGQYRFHITLTGRMPRETLPDVQAEAEVHFAEMLPVPFTIDFLSLVGERPDGKWVIIQRCPLA